jgi:uncharacterized protein
MATGEQKANAAVTFWNHVFLLNLFSCSDEPLDNLKIQKLTFITEEKARNQKFAAAYFPFFRYDFGPFSKDLAEDVDYLQAYGFIDYEFRRPTKRGKYILEYVADYISQSRQAVDALRLLESVCQQYKDMKSSRLVDFVYQMKVSVVGLCGEVKTVGEIPKCVDILVPEQERLTISIPFPDDLLEDLTTEFSLMPEELDPRSEANLKRAHEVIAKALAL